MITEKTATVIDNILTSEFKPMTTGIFTCKIADHLSPFLIIETTKKPKQSNQKHKQRMITIRERKQENIDAFKDALKLESWQEVLSKETVHEKQRNCMTSSPSTTMNTSRRKK